MPRLAGITIYPWKSLNGQGVTEALVLPGGALEHDRRFALVDEDGSWVNGKRTNLFHQILSSYDASERVISLRLRGRGDWSVFHVDADREALNLWFGDHLGVPISVTEAPETGFPDDTDSPGPTLIAVATLESVAGWFEEIADLDDCRRRFRTNLEIGGTEPFWDDRLVGEAGEPVRFRVGDVSFEGTNPCQRCPVPARGPEPGMPTRGFPGRFGDLRRQTLPSWAVVSRFDHFYRLAVNTRPAGLGSPGGMIRVGDVVEIF